MILCLMIISLVRWVRAVRWFGEGGRLSVYLKTLRQFWSGSMKAKLVLLPNAVIGGVDDRRWIEAATGDLMVLRIHSRDVAGAFTVVEARVMPLSGPPLHIHHERDEIFELLDGRFRFQCGDEIFDVSAGTTVVVPRGMPHSWVNLGSRPARLLFSFVPGGVEKLIEEVSMRPPEEWAALATQYDTAVVGPPLVVEGATEPCRGRRAENVTFLIPREGLMK
jgi:mannose-6-phosphate isomerase-like protein (cupin superfamily)